MSFLLGAAVSIAVGCSVVESEMFDSNAALWKTISKQSLEKKLCSEYGDEYESISFYPKKFIDRTVHIKGQSLGLQVGDIKSGILNVSEVVVTDSGKEAIAKSLWLDVEAYKSIWVLRKRGILGKKIKKSHLEKKTINVSSYLGNAGIYVDKPFGERFSKSLKKGAVLTRDAVLKEPILKSGDVVSLQINRGSVMLKTRGKVLRAIKNPLSDVLVKPEVGDKLLKGKLISLENKVVDIAL